MQQLSTRNRSKQYRRDGWFVGLVLLACGIWKYEASIRKLGHEVVPFLPLILLVLVSCMVAMWILTKLWRRRHYAPFKRLDTMTGLEFEQYVAALLRKCGFAHVSLTERYDLGVDITAYKDDVKWGIQVKRLSSLVKAIAVRQVVTALNLYDCDRAMIISNSIYSRPAQQLALHNDCRLIDRTGLLQMIEGRWQ